MTFRTENVLRTCALLFTAALMVLMPLCGAIDGAKIEISSPYYECSDSATAIELADIDGDEDMDIVVATSGSMKPVSVLYNNGTGSLTRRTDSSALWDLLSMDLADLDGDGDMDAAAGSGPAFGMTVLLNNGTGYPISGTGASDGDGRTDYGVAGFFCDTAFGDIDGDKDQDMIVSSAESGFSSVKQVVLNYNSGSGTFPTKYIITTDNMPGKIAVQDVNGDSRPDLIIGEGNRFSITLNNGTGFPYGDTPANDADNRTDYDLQSYAGDFALGDLNGDGYPDLAVTAFSTGIASIFFNEGDGKFGNRTDYSIGISPEGLTLGDLDGDGDLDLLSTSSQEGFIAVWYNNGKGTMSQKLEINSAKGVRDVELGDMDGDGDMDIVTANGVDSDGVSVILNRGKGTFGIRSNYRILTGFNNLYSIDAADLDNDGSLDLLFPTIYYTSPVILIANGSGGGGFTLPNNYTIAGGSQSARFGDLDKDGWMDVAAMESSEPPVLTVLLNDGIGNLPASGTPAYDSDKRTDYTLANTTRFFQMADIDNDGDPDILNAEGPYGQVSVYKNNGAGRFLTRNSYLLPGVSPTTLAMGDVNGDDKIDIVCGLSWDTKISVLLNSGTGTFKSSGTPAADGDGRTDYLVSEDIAHMELCDIDADSDLDLVFVTGIDSTSTNKAVVYKNDGMGAFSFSSSTVVGKGPIDIQTADIDGDGYPDLAIACYWDDKVYVLFNNGLGGFTTSKKLIVKERPVGIAPKDIDGDSDIDLLVLCQYSSYLSVFMNFENTGFLADSDGDGAADSIDAFPDDMNEWMDSDGDGHGDNSDDLPWNPYEYRDTDGDGYGDQFEDEFPQNPTEWKDSDSDGWGDNGDAFPQDPREWWDTDNDSVGDNSDDFPDDPAASKDTDNDHYPDAWNTGKNETYSTTGLTLDAFPLDPSEHSDDDGDGVGDNSDDLPNNPTQWKDSDSDGYGDNATGMNADAFPFDRNEWVDSDHDGVGDNSDEFPINSSEWKDADNDGHGDNSDAFPANPLEWDDSDGDGKGDNSDAFPLDPEEWKDTDNDGHGDNGDAFPSDNTEWNDTDRDGFGDNEDEFPANPLEWSDNDGDGIGDNTDNDDDNDGYTDEIETKEGSNPLSGLSKPIDNDGDLIPDSMDDDDDNDGYTDNMETSYGTDPLDSADRPFDVDKDGVPDAADPDDDNDGTPDVRDEFPFDPAADTDTDKDGIPDMLFPGVNTTLTEDTDDDNDGVPDTEDAFPTNPLESRDTDGDGFGDDSDLDDDNDGWSDVIELAAGSNALNATSAPLDTDGNGVPDYQDADDDGDGYPDEMEINLGTDPMDNMSVPEDTDGDLIPDEMDSDDDNDGVPDFDDFDPKDPKVQTDPDLIEIPIVHWRFSLGELVSATLFTIALGVGGFLIVTRKNWRFKKLLKEFEDIEDEHALEEFEDRLNDIISDEDIGVGQSMGILELVKKKKARFKFDKRTKGIDVPKKVKEKIDEVLDDETITKDEIKDIRETLEDTDLPAEDKRAITTGLNEARKEMEKEPPKPPAD